MQYHDTVLSLMYCVYRLLIIMNHSCLACDRPATRACIHPKCTQIPFLCSDKCKNNKDMALILHTHDGANHFMDYNELMDKLFKLEDQGHTQYLNSTRKRINIIKDDLDCLVKRMEDLHRGCSQNLTKKAKEIIEMVLSRRYYKELEGRNLKELLDGKSIYESSPEVDDRVKKTFVEIVSRLESTGLNQIIRADIKAASEHFIEGEKLFEQQKFKSALKQYELANQLNPHDPDAIFGVGYCYRKLDNSLQALKYYGEYISLASKGHQKYASCLNKIGQIFSQRGDNQVAIDYYTRAIRIDGQMHMSYYGRGACYSKIGEYQEALKDLTAAINIRPLKMHYTMRSQIYKQLGRDAEAKKDAESMVTAPQI